ncbi:MAG: hypothetical protein ABR576_12410 [Thermoanaerobaculia bacterium]
MMFLSDDTLEHLRDVADRPDLSQTPYTLVARVAPPQGPAPVVPSQAEQKKPHDEAA